MNLTMKDGSVKFSLAISQEEIKKMMAARRAAHRKAHRRPGEGGSAHDYRRRHSGRGVRSRAATDGGTTVFVLPGEKVGYSTVTLLARFRG